MDRHVPHRTFERLFDFDITSFFQCPSVGCEIELKGTQRPLRSEGISINPANSCGKDIGALIADGLHFQASIGSRSCPHCQQTVAEDCGGYLFTSTAPLLSLTVDWDIGNADWWPGSDEIMGTPEPGPAGPSGPSSREAADSGPPQPFHIPTELAFDARHLHNSTVHEEYQWELCGIVCQSGREFDPRHHTAIVSRDGSWWSINAKRASPVDNPSIAAFQHGSQPLGVFYSRSNVLAQQARSTEDSTGSKQYTFVSFEQWC